MTVLVLKILVLFGLMLEIINPMTPFVRIDPLTSQQHHIFLSLKFKNDTTADRDSLPDESKESDEEDEGILDAHASTLAKFDNFHCSIAALHLIVFPEHDRSAEGLAKQTLHPPITA